MRGSNAIPSDPSHLCACEASKTLQMFNDGSTFFVADTSELCYGVIVAVKPKKWRDGDILLLGDQVADAHFLMGAVEQGDSLGSCWT